jgi:hypothetical protein
MDGSDRSSKAEQQQQQFPVTSHPISVSVRLVNVKLLQLGMLLQSLGLCCCMLSLHSTRHRLNSSLWHYRLK